jgi:hypothetical protein
VPPVSYADIVPGTETERLLAAMERLEARQTAVAEAVNGVGEKIQWIIERTEGIFQTFGSPQMMSMLPQMMSGAMGAVPGMEDAPHD